MTNEEWHADIIISEEAEFFKLYGDVNSPSWQYASFIGMYIAFTHKSLCA